MGFKEYERNMSFLDLELSKTLGSSRTQKFLKEIHDYIRWEPIERILLDVYPQGYSDIYWTSFIDNDSVSDDCLNYEAITPGVNEESGTRNGGIGTTGVSFGMGMMVETMKWCWIW